MIGFFAIDVKSWSGRIFGSDAIWVRDDGSSEGSPLGKIDFVAKVLAGHLRAKVSRFRELAGHPVVGCVLLTRAAARPGLQDPRAADGVLLLPDAVAALVRRDARGGNPRVGALRQQIEKTLFDLSPRPKIPKRVGPYTIVEVASGPAGSHLLRATHAEGGERLLTMYNVTGEPGLRDFHLQESRALQQLRATGVVPECLDSFPWSEDFLVVPTMPPMGISLSALPRPEDEDGVVRELRRGAAAFRALARVHAAGVVHRALRPESIYVDECGNEPAVMLTGFFAARRGNQTISPRLDSLAIDDPYVAPEIALAGSYGFAGPESDAYSLALIFLERLSGIPVARLVTGEGVRFPDPGEGWGYFPQEIVEAAEAFFRVALSRGPLAARGSGEAARLSADDCAARLEDLARRFRADVAPMHDELLDGRYRVVRLLGAGASARTLLATDTEASGQFALKQFLCPASLSESGEARREFDLLRNHPHPNLPRVYDVYPATHDVHVKLEYIEGVKLSDVLSRYTGRIERWRRLAGDLLDAVEHLERHKLLHRDIKPDNVLVRDDTGAAVLIDFGAATHADARLGVAGTPGFLPPEAYFSEKPPASTDRYALGVLLFQALTGRLPFVQGSDPFSPQILDDVEFAPEETRPFARALLRAVAANPADRYASAAAFRMELLAPDSALEAGDVSEPRRSIEGELLDFLLRLSPEQERLTFWSLNAKGPTLVKGGPGTGKTTVALHRVRGIIEASRARGARPRILFTTYTNALVTFCEQQLRRLLGPDMDCVTVRTADSIVRKIVTSVPGEEWRPADVSVESQTLKEVLAAHSSVTAQPIADLSVDYLLAEFGAVIEARELVTLDDYLDAPRTGRQVRLNRA